MYEKFDAALFDELQSIYPDTSTKEGVKHYRVSSANGGYAGVHIMLNGLKPGIPVTVEVIGDHRSYRLFNMAALPVEVNTGAKQRSEYLKDDINEYVIRRAPFMVYDVYRPMFNILNPTGVTAAIAFLAKTEYIRKFRSRKWTFIISHAGETQKLEFVVDEYPVRIPSTQEQKQRYVNWFNYGVVAKNHGLEPWSAAHYNMIKKYFDVLVYSRQNMAPIHPIYGLVDGKPVLDIEKMEKIVDLAIEAGFTWFNGTAFTGRASGQDDDQAFFDSLPHDTFEGPEEVSEAFKKAAFDAFDYGTDALCMGELIPGEKGEAYLKDLSEQMYEFVNRKGLNDRWLQCCMDEPNDALENTYRRIVDIMHEAMPGIKMLEPMLPTHALDDTIEVWCPSLDIYEQDKEYYDAQVAKGVELFVYSCLTPGGNYCNRLLDMEHLRQVWLCWAPILYPNITGFLHWASVGSNELYERSAKQFVPKPMDFFEKYAMMLPAGDCGCIFSWGDMPCVTARTEGMRIGYEDLGLLEQLPYEEALAICKKVFNGYADYTKDIALYRKVKDELMKAVMAKAE